MQTNRFPYQLHLFTLRLWQEVLDGEEWEWRGKIKNTKTGEVHFFRNNASLYSGLLVMLDDPHQDVSDATAAASAR